VSLRHQEFSELQAGRKESNERWWDLRLNGHGKRQRQETRDQTEHPEHQVAE
jgi:hypothetical protein